MAPDNSNSLNAQDEIHPGDDAAPGTPGTGEDICPVCGGKGQVSDRECDNCGGTGRIVKAIGGA